MRDRARAVVVGGGVGGCAIAYWLTRLGWDDIVLGEDLGSSRSWSRPPARGQRLRVTCYERERFFERG
jgi:glycine/D-amino acid oxidase-like deaminating enzyme